MFKRSDLAWNLNRDYIVWDSDPQRGASFSGTLTKFETDLFIAAHEIAHQYGIDDEQQADGAGIKALQNYRKDGGAQCP